ncbi:MAG TPA: hypothetical protein VFY25_12125 [Anaerolineales bacterium]|nr:hypothetical protein [Anaerolineales bacterium]
MKPFAGSTIVLCLLLLSACGAPLAAPASPTFTRDPDPCSAQNLPVTVEGINDLTRQFDEVSPQISTSSQGLAELIADLQRIRRAAEDLTVPACLEVLKTHQLNYMNLVIQSLIVFLGNAEADMLRNGMELAQQEHSQYSLEMVRLLGITLAPVTTPRAP